MHNYHPFNIALFFKNTTIIKDFAAKKAWYPDKTITQYIDFTKVSKNNTL